MVDKITTSSTPPEIVDVINAIIDSMPDVGNGTIIIKQDDNIVGTFNLNQKTNTTIEVAGASGIVDQVFNPTSIRPQSGAAIAGENYLKEHQSLSHLQLKSNLVTELTESSTDEQYPSAKVVYNKIKNINSEAHGDWVYRRLEVSTTSNGKYKIGGSSSWLSPSESYLPEDADIYWYEVLMHVAAYDNGDSVYSYFRNICLNEDLTIAHVSGYGRQTQNTFIMAFPPGSREKEIPYTRAGLIKTTEFELGHTLALTRNKTFKSYQFLLLGYRRLGKTPFEYPDLVPSWAWLS